jgi:hypothetical protein
MTDMTAALSEVEREVLELERSLAGAKRRKQVLEQQRKEDAQRAAEEAQQRGRALAEEQQRQNAAIEEQQAEEQRKKQAQQASSKSTPEDIAAYEERIADLKRQIAQAQADKATPQAEEEPYDEEQYYEEEEILEEDEYEEEEILEEDYTEIEMEVEEDHAKHSDTAAAVHAQAQTNPSARDYAEVRQDQLDHLKTQNQWAAPNYGPKSNDVQRYSNDNTPGHTHLVDKSDALKQKYQFEKPAWASKNSADVAAESIDTNPIQNPLLKKNAGTGYTRQVFAKETQARSKGTYVAPRKDAPPPRLAWIVVDINKRKAGKIVLHLYGQGVEAIVEQFPKLTGKGLERNGNNRPICVEELESPKFYITTNSTTKGLENKKDTYGLVQEGKEIIAAIKKADEHASITIRQSHVFPVKQTKA